jgi:rod shape-determining protein MreC
MSAKSVQQRAPLVLAVLLLLQLILMSLSARHPNGEHSVLGAWGVAVLTPVVKGLDSLVGAVTGTVGGIADLRGAREENVELRKLIEQLTQERDSAREKASELDHLRNQLALPSNPEYRQLAANVVSRDINVWFRHMLIDRGSFDGVKLNMPAVTSVGIVGRVIEVGPNYSRIQMITDTYAGAGAMLQQSRVMGELRGQSIATSICELKNISSSEPVEVGEAVVTTGLDGIYPKGLKIGTVERVESDPNGPWHRVIVRPSSPVDRLENLFVLLIEPRDLKMQETISRPR